MSYPIRGGAQSVVGSGSGIQAEVGHDPFYASTDGTRAENLGIVSIYANSLFYSLLHMFCGIGDFIPICAYLACRSSIDCCGSLI